MKKRCRQILRALGIISIFAVGVNLNAALEVDHDIDKANSYDDDWELGPKGWVVTMQQRHDGFSGAAGALVINGDSNLDRGPGWMWMNLGSSTDPGYPKDHNGNPMPTGLGHTDPDSVWMGYDDQDILEYLRMDEWSTSSDLQTNRENSYNAIELAVIGDPGDDYGLFPGGVRTTAWNGTGYSNWLNGVHTGTVIPSYQEMFSEGATTTKPVLYGRDYRDFEFFFVSLGTNDLRNGSDAAGYAHNSYTALTKVLDPNNHTIPMLSSCSRTSANYECFENGIPMLPIVARTLSIPYVAFDEEGMRRARKPDCWKAGQYGYVYVMGDSLHYSGQMVPGYYANPYENTTVYNNLLGANISGDGANLSNNYALLRGWLLTQKVKEIKAKVVDVTHSAPANVTLTATANAHNEIELSWTGGDRAAYFELQRRKSGGRWQMVSKAIAPTATSYTDEKRTAGGVDYEYRLRAVNGFGAGFGAWDTDTVTTPAAPTLVSIQLADDSGEAAVNGLFTYEVIGSYQDGSISIVNDIVELSFDNASIAEKLASGSGTAVGKAAGSTGVTATAAGKTATGTITVTATEDLLPTDDAFSAMTYTGDPGFHGDDTTLKVRYSATYQWSYISYLKFDLEELSRTDFDTASLDLYLSTGGGSTVNIAALYGTSANQLDRWSEDLHSYTYGGGILRNGTSSASDPNANINGGGNIGNGSVLGSVDSSSVGWKSLSNAALESYCSGQYGLGDGYDADVTFGLVTSNGNNIAFNSKEAASNKPKLSFSFAAVPGDISTLSTAPAYETDVDNGFTAPPILTADSTDNDVDHDIVITFTDADGWAASVIAVSVDGTTLTATDDYVLNGAGGTLTLKASDPTADTALHTPGDWSVVVTASGFSNAGVTQTVAAGDISMTESSLTVVPDPDLGVTSTATATLLDQYTNPIVGHILKYNVTVTDNDGTTNESYTINGTGYDASATGATLTATDANGETSFDIIIPATVDAEDGVAVQVKLNDGTTSFGDPIAYGGKTPPILTADSTDNTVDNDIVITFTDADGWAAAVTTVKIGGTEIPSSDWAINGAGGTLTLEASDPAAAATLHAADNWTVSVLADGFVKNEVVQTVGPGVADTDECYIFDEVTLVRELIMQTTLRAKDQYGNAIPNYVFKYNATKVNNDSTLNETYSIHDESDVKLVDINASVTNQSLPAADANGQIIIGLYVPDYVDWDDGIQFQFLLNDGVTTLGNVIEYSEIDGQRSLAYSTTTYAEDAANDGSITNDIVVTLSNDTFTAGVTSNISMGNVPAGLSPSYTRDSDTQVTISLTGNATNHETADSVSDVSISFADGAFTEGNAATVLNRSRSDIAVNYLDTFDGETVYVNTDYSGASDGSFDQPYKSLFDWEAAEQQNLVTAATKHRVMCFGATADTTAVTVDGWTTDADNYIVITTLPSARHAGVWDNSKYRLANASTDSAITIKDAYTQIDGLQISNSSTGSGITLQYSGNVTIKNCIIKGGNNGISASDSGVGDDDCVVYNNIVYDTLETGIALGSQRDNWLIYNNTVHNCNTSSINYRHGIAAGSTDNFVVNNLVFDCPSGGYMDGINSGTQSYNTTSDDTASGTGAVINANSTDYFVNVAGDDFHLKTGSPAIGTGDDLSVTFDTDIDGDERSSWDRGADEHQAGGPSLSYSGSIFDEAVANDGSIDNTSPITITLTDDSFTGSDSDDFVDDGKIVVSNLPVGLTAVATRTSSTVLSVTLTGNAAAHASADDVSDLTFTFQDTAFTGGSASSVTNYNKSNLMIDFDDPPAPSISISGSATEGEENGAVITVTLSNASFTDPLTAGNWTLSNLPAGVTKGIVTRVDDTHATIALSGNRTTDYDTNITNATVECGAAEHSGSGALSDNTGFTFTARVESLSYSAASFAEAAANDGSIDNTSPVVITLSGDTFTGSDSDDFVAGGKIIVSNLPAGLTAVATRTDSTHLSVTITGNAAAHANADDVADLTFSFQNNAFTHGIASGVTNYAKSDLAVDFADAGPSQTTLNPVKDSYVNSAAATTNYGSEILIDSQGNNTALSQRISLMGFDLSGIPVGSTINSATLRVYCNNETAGDYGGQVTVQGVNDDWTEAGATYNTTDGSTAWMGSGNINENSALDGLASATDLIINRADTDPSYTAGQFPNDDWNTGDHLVDFDVASLVEDWIDGTRDNYGLAVCTTGEVPTVGTYGYFNLKWQSRENTNQPELIISYVASTPEPSLTYSGATFNEAVANDGSIDNTTPVTITLADDLFTGSNGDNFVSGGKIVVSNLPAGLSAVATRVSPTQLSVTITGNAAAHANANDVSDLTFSFQNTAFANSDAAEVANYAKSNLAVDFIDASSADYTVGVAGDFPTITAALAACSGGEVIEVIDAVHTEEGIAVNKAVTIQGLGADNTIVQANAVQGAASDRVFNVTAAGTILADMTIRHGNIAGDGGGILAAADLTISGCEILDNSSTGGNGGGGIAVTSGSALVVMDSVLAGNASTLRGGGIMFFSAGSGNLENCTITDNTSTRDNTAAGGGIYVYNTGGGVEIRNCTIAGNTASAGNGGGLESWDATVNIYNSIIAGNTSGDNIGHDVFENYASAIVNDSYCVIGKNDGSDLESGAPNGNGSVVGTNASPVDANLAALADNDGPTRTMAPNPGSPALRLIPRGSDPFYNDSPAEDQRGYWIDTPTDDPDYTARTCGAYWDAASATPARGFRGWVE